MRGGRARRATLRVTRSVRSAWPSAPRRTPRRYPTVRGDRPDVDFALRNAWTSAGESEASVRSPRAGARWSRTTYRYDAYVRGRTVTRATSVSQPSRKAPTMSSAPAAGRPTVLGPSAPRSRSRTADRVRERNEGGAVSRAGRRDGGRSVSYTHLRAHETRH